MAASNPQLESGDTLDIGDALADELVQHVAPAVRDLASREEMVAPPSSSFDEPPDLGGEERTVDNWQLGKTLGKGAYGIVKIGYMRGSSRPFALKFMHKDEKWNRRDEQMVANEINCLKRVRHNNVTRLMAYRLNCQYPKSDGTTIDSVLLVMELCNGGELFDILFYTQQLTQELARTYMVQLMNGLAAIHAAGITHRDLKPQNCLLDGNFNLKIADFGLSNIFEGEGLNILKTTIIGTKGFRAPEIVLNRKYTNSCDIFACGVIMFIMLWGYPPFETANATDNWYRPIATKKYKKFYKKHKSMKCIDTSAKDLLVRMLAYQPSERATLAQVQEHEWMGGEIYEGKALIDHMRDRHQNSMEAKKLDSKKQAALNESMTRALDDFGVKYDLTQLPPIIDVNQVPAFDSFSIADEHHAYSVLDLLHDFIREKGDCRFYPENFVLEGDLQLATNERINITARCFRLDDSETSYICFSRTCPNFLGSSMYYQNLLKKLSHMFDGPLHTTREVYNYDDIDFEDNLEAIPVN